MAERAQPARDPAKDCDIVVVGTGITESLLATLLVRDGYSLFIIDTEAFYGGECTSLDIREMWKRYRWTDEQKHLDFLYRVDPSDVEELKTGPEPPAVFTEPAQKGTKAPQWLIPLVPKFLMADGDLTKYLRKIFPDREGNPGILLAQIGGSFVVTGGKPYRVPTTPSEAAFSSLLTLSQKYLMRGLLQYIAGYKEEDPSTHNGLNLDQITAQELFDKYSIDSTTASFIGHAMALYQDDAYLTGTARDTVNRIILYVRSMAVNGPSPYVFPYYGLREIPERFSMETARRGSQYALNTKVGEVVYENGVVAGLKYKNQFVSKDETVVKAKKVISSPSHLLGKPDASKLRKTGKLVRAVCLITRPIKGIGEAHSAQIIIPASQCGRKNDIYISVIGHLHNACPKGYQVCNVSTIVEDPNGNPLAELEPGLKVIGLGNGFLDKNEEKFVSVVDLYEPAPEKPQDNLFITKSYDASTHFESCIEDVQRVYKEVTGKDLDLSTLE
ncbi:rab GTPase activator [Ascobolus immersus RN42]|uniref:Rab GTPase activator n=1 Tax=Ascobolus immersus RN42 TaxID=1160509 RepID=A0A3N4IN13_ASCIM|nr:rab GTPase activator [Ascobolus immersus RN42]